ncbi:hypothetical protein TetV_176 [Tetraselmis virus 1]|uniref:Uncharacterized protein n=1 Tax=Tetraselmis virus 1 TaxID=2060617 RepID=A0A2P0VMY3_9VIRU|nr:hypothetical protein QJ968_gp176 [Tetraselmis virus 1]AUF82268.1 hypothetical protein TetV_176 [Tetraselmis virus 1]
MDFELLVYVVAFSGIYILALVVIMSFAWSWRNRKNKIKQQQRADKAAAYSEISVATHRIEDALSHQSRFNENANRRVRIAEETAKRGYDQSQKNKINVENAIQRNANLTDSYIQATDVIRDRITDLHEAVDESRTATIERSRTANEALRELEDQITALQHGAITPEDINKMVAETETELEKHTLETQKASKGFYNTVDKLLTDTEDARNTTFKEISDMYATKQYVSSVNESYNSEIEALKKYVDEQQQVLADVATAATEVCKANTDENQVSDVTLDEISSMYEELLRNVGAYDDDLKQYKSDLSNAQTHISEIKKQFSDLEGTNQEMTDSLKAFNDTKNTLIEKDSYDSLEERVGLLESKAQEAISSLKSATDSANMSSMSCQKAEDICGKALIYIKDGVEMDTPTGRLVFDKETETLQMCDNENNCSPINVKLST